MSQILRGGSVSWLRKFRLGCASLCTRYNGLDPRTAPWSGKMPAADTGSSTWYCHTTCIVSFWNTKDDPKSKRGVSFSAFCRRKLSIEKRSYKGLCLCTQVRHKNCCFRKKLLHTTRIKVLWRRLRSAASFNQIFCKIYDRKLHQTNHISHHS